MKHSPGGFTSLEKLLFTVLEKNTWVRLPGQVPLLWIRGGDEAEVEEVYVGIAQEPRGTDTPARELRRDYRRVRAPRAGGRIIRGPGALPGGCLEH